MFDRLPRCAWRHIVAVGVAVLVGVVVAHYYVQGHEVWLVGAAFLVAQSTRRAPLRQAVLYFFGMVILAMLMSINAYESMAGRIADVSMGSVLGALCGQFILPVNLYANFSRDVLPLLDALIAYANTLFVGPRDLLTARKRQIELILQAGSGLYPEWVYAFGFNPGLRAGFRFFLVHLEQVAEVIFSMHYWAGRDVDADLLAALTSDMANVMQKNVELFDVLREFLLMQAMSEYYPSTDFTSDVVALEAALNQCVPASLDLLDVSVDYIAATALVRDLKDMRELLLQLVLALPVQA